MVEKLEQNQIFMPIEVANKVNELIDAYNKLEEQYEDHTHVTEDGVGPTSGPYSI